MCGPVCGKDVYYSLDNLRHYLISQGENYDSVIEKFALHISNYKSLSNNVVSIIINVF